MKTAKSFIAILFASTLLSFGGLVAAQSPAPVQTRATRAPQAKVTAGRLDWMFATKRYEELERTLPSADLSSVDRQYFEGMLANLRNDLPRAIEFLSKVVPQLEKSNSPRTARAMRLLANSFVREYRYTDAAKLYKEVVAKYADAFERNDKQSLEDDAATVALLDGAAAQRIVGPASFSVPWQRSKIGSIDVAATSHGITMPWLVDTGANFSVLVESAARRLNVKLSEGVARTQGITGDENPLRIGIVPEIKLGSATIENVAVLVLPDKNLNVNFGKDRYQIEAILGFPVLEALGKVTITSPGADAGEIRVQRNSGTPAPQKGSAMFIEELEPLVAARIGTHDVLFAFDTGADNSIFTSKYYQEFTGDLMNLSKSAHGVGGAGGSKKIDAVRQPKLTLEIGGTTDVLNNVTVITERMGTHLDVLHGNMGRDITDNFHCFTIDFRNMRFELAR